MKRRPSSQHAGPDAGAPGGELFEAMYTLGAVRRFRPDPVADTTITRIVEAATHAPSARNAEPWFFLAVRHPEKKQKLGRLYLEAWEGAAAYTRATDADRDVKERPAYPAMMRAVDDLAHHLGEAPVLVLACLDTRQLGPMADGQGSLLSPQSAYASIFPAVQNLMLAARALGLGTTLTTVFHSVESRMRAVLGIPGHVHIAALLPLGYPTQPFRPTKRKPAREVLFFDSWGNSPPLPPGEEGRGEERDPPPHGRGDT